MDSCNELDVSSIVPEVLVSIPAIHVDIRPEVLSPALPTGHSTNPGDPISLSPTGTFNSSRGSADVCADEDEINAMYPTPSLVHFVLRNFTFAMFLISLIVSVERAQSARERAPVD